MRRVVRCNNHKSVDMQMWRANWIWHLAWIDLTCTLIHFDSHDFGASPRRDSFTPPSLTFHLIIHLYIYIYIYIQKCHISTPKLPTNSHTHTTWHASKVTPSMLPSRITSCPLLFAWVPFGLSQYLISIPIWSPGPLIVLIVFKIWISDATDPTKPDDQKVSQRKKPKDRGHKLLHTKILPWKLRRVLRCISLMLKPCFKTLEWLFVRDMFCWKVRLIFVPFFWSGNWIFFGEIPCNKEVDESNFFLVIARAGCFPEASLVCFGKICTYISSKVRYNNTFIWRSIIQPSIFSSSLFMFTGVDPFVGSQRCHLFGDHAASQQEKALHAKVDLKKDPSFSHETQQKAFYT